MQRKRLHSGRGSSSTLTASTPMACLSTPSSTAGKYRVAHRPKRASIGSGVLQAPRTLPHPPPPRRPETAEEQELRLRISTLFGRIGPAKGPTRPIARFVEVDRQYASFLHTLETDVDEHSPFRKELLRLLNAKREELYRWLAVDGTAHERPPPRSEELPGTVEGTLPDSVWAEWWSVVQDAFLVERREHAKLHPRCTWIDGNGDEGAVRGFCKSWTAALNMLMERWMSREIYDYFLDACKVSRLSPQDYQKARATVWGVRKSIHTIAVVERYNLPVRARGMRCEREELNAWRQAITDMFDEKKCSSVQNIRREVHGWPAWRWLPKPERRFLDRYFDAQEEQDRANGVEFGSSKQSSAASSVNSSNSGSMGSSSNSKSKSSKSSSSKNKAILQPRTVDISGIKCISKDNRAGPLKPPERAYRMDKWLTDVFCRSGSGVAVAAVEETAKSMGKAARGMRKLQYLPWEDSAISSVSGSSFEGTRFPGYQ